jgi:hypothetical protein
VWLFVYASIISKWASLILRIGVARIRPIPERSLKKRFSSLAAQGTTRFDKARNAI